MEFIEVKKRGFEAGLTSHTKEHDLCTSDDKDISLSCDENESIYVYVFQDYIKRYLRGIWVFLQLTCEYYIGEYPLSFLSLHPYSYRLCHVLRMKSLIILLQDTSAYLCTLFVCVQLV